MNASDIIEQGYPEWITEERAHAILERHHYDAAESAAIVAESTDADGRIDLRVLLGVMGY